MNYQSGRRYSLALQSGIMAAALAANSPVFAMKLSTDADVRARIDRLRLMWTTITAFTVPVTAGRRLELIRATGVSADSGGTDIVDIGKRFARDDVSKFDDSVAGSFVRMATTGTLTLTAPTFESHPMIVMPLSHVGAAGGFLDVEHRFMPTEGNELVVSPGESLVLRNPVVMDAAGTWQLTVLADWREVPIN